MARPDPEDELDSEKLLEEMARPDPEPTNKQTNSLKNWNFEIKVWTEKLGLSSLFHSVNWYNISNEGIDFTAGGIVPSTILSWAPCFSQAPEGLDPRASYLLFRIYTYYWKKTKSGSVQTTDKQMSL